MSILEASKVDMIGVPAENSENVVVLGIADHLPWGDDSDHDHLLMLQEKINYYLAFIESGEINVAFPPASGRNPVIRLMSKFEPSSNGQEFVREASKVLGEVGIGFQVKVG